MTTGRIRDIPLAMNDESSRKVSGRLTGWVYLIMIGFSAAGYATMTRLLAGDSQVVLERLAAEHALFGLALASMAVGFVTWLVLAVMLYRLMSSSGRLPGLLMLLFTVAGAAMNLLALSRLLPLVSTSGSGLDAGTLVPVVESYNHLLILAQVFSGLWMFPFGWLVIRSRIVPQLLGYCLMAGGVAYLLIPIGAFNPGLNEMLTWRIISLVSGIPALVGEIGVCLWLLIKGASEPTRVGVLVV